jgi:hypothetical protein
MPVINESATGSADSNGFSVTVSISGNISDSTGAGTLAMRITLNSTNNNFSKYTINTSGLMTSTTPNTNVISNGTQRTMAKNSSLLVGQGSYSVSASSSERSFKFVAIVDGTGTASFIPNNARAETTISLSAPTPSTPAPTWSTTSIPDAAVVGTTYSQQLSATNTTSYSRISGSLPGGVSLDSSGLLSGTVSAGATATFNFTVRASGAGGTADSAEFTLNRTQPPPPAPVWSAVSTATAQVGQSFDIAYTATNTTTYSLQSGSLPSGLTINPSNGTISGTVNAGASETFNFTLRAVGGGGTTDSGTFSIKRVQPAPIWSTTSLNQVARVGVPFSTTVSASNIQSSNAYSVPNNSLPNGLSIDSNTGVISGTPSAGNSQTFSFRVTATGDGGSTQSNLFTLDRRQPLVVWVDDTLDTTNLRVGQSYSDSVSANNAATYSVSGLPIRGISMSSSSSSATVSGTPTSTASFSFTITAANSDGTRVGRTYTFTPKAAFPVWSDQTLAVTSIAKGVAYSDLIFASNASSYGVNSGALPPGITLNATTGAISGVPTTVGIYSFVLRATNASSDSILTNTLTLTITPAGSGSVWNGSAWVQAPFKVWNGSTWVESAAKVWNGSSWADPVSS